MAKVADLNERLRALDRRFAASIESLSSVYPDYKLNPDFSTYSTKYAADIGSIDSIHEDYAAMRQKISEELDGIQRKLTNINGSINLISDARKDMEQRSSALVGAEESAVGQSAFFDSRYRGKLWGIAGLVAGSAFILYRSIAK